MRARRKCSYTMLYIYEFILKKSLWSKSLRDSRESNLKDARKWYGLILWKLRWCNKSSCLCMEARNTSNLWILQKDKPKMRNPLVLTAIFFTVTYLRIKVLSSFWSKFIWNLFPGACWTEQFHLLSEWLNCTCSTNYRPPSSFPNVHVTLFLV